MNEYDPYDVIPEKIDFETCAAFEPRLRRIANRIAALKLGNFKRTGDQHLHGNNAENVWYGIGTNHVGIWDQIVECVGRESDNKYEFLRTDEAYTVCLNHLSELYGRRENYEYENPDMTWWNKHLYRKGK